MIVNQSERELANIPSDCEISRNGQQGKRYSLSNAITGVLRGGKSLEPERARNDFVGRSTKMKELVKIRKIDGVDKIVTNLEWVVGFEEIVKELKQINEEMDGLFWADGIVDKLGDIFDRLTWILEKLEWIVWPDGEIVRAIQERISELERLFSQEFRLRLMKIQLNNTKNDREYETILVSMKDDYEDGCYDWKFCTKKLGSGSGCKNCKNRILLNCINWELERIATTSRR